MTTLVLEDGSGLTNSNSYVSVTEADDYFLGHPFYADTWDALGVPDKENLLVSATATLDALITWYGYLYSDSQALGWPRTYVADSEGRVIASNVVPAKVKNATCELAVYASKGDPFAAPSSVGVDRLKIDVIELQFNKSEAKAPVPAATLLALRGLGEYTLGTRVRKVLVG
jgi:hypothetical protein